MRYIILFLYNTKGLVLSFPMEILLCTLISKFTFHSKSNIYLDILFKRTSLWIWQPIQNLDKTFGFSEMSAKVCDTQHSKFWEKLNDLTQYRINKLGWAEPHSSFPNCNESRCVAVVVVVRALVYQPSGPGFIPVMSPSESAITRGNPIMLLPSSAFSWTTCLYHEHTNKFEWFGNQNCWFLKGWPQIFLFFYNLNPHTRYTYSQSLHFLPLQFLIY